MYKKFLVVYGPTGVGKTDFSMLIANISSVEIINMDVGQFYVPFTIGTAKPSNHKELAVTHHMFDILDEPKDISVATYRTQIIHIMNEIWQRGKLPVLVGGSGFYLRSLLFPPSLKLSSTSFYHVNDTKENSWDLLYRIDPVRAQEIERHDTYRITRALHIWRTTGQKPSHYKPSYQPFADYKILFLTRDRQELYSRINRRVELMLRMGWIDEVEAVLSTEWENFILRKKLIGYNELLHYVRNNRPSFMYDKIVGKIKQRTRHYAKRQHTFWRMLTRQIYEADTKKKNDLYTVNISDFENKDYNDTLISMVKDW